MYAQGKTIRSNETARLLSVVFKQTNASRGSCRMRFYYHLHGSLPPILSIKMITSAVSNEGIVLWQKSGKFLHCHILYAFQLLYP